MPKPPPVPKNLFPNRPFFALALHRAARVQLKAGKITKEQFEQVSEAVAFPVRKDKDGKTCNLLDELQTKSVTMMQADQTFEATYGFSISQLITGGINWQGLWKWIEDHLPQILECLASLISIFVLLG